MATFNYYQMTNEDLERNADYVKVVLLDALVKEGVLDKDQAEEWSESHTIVRRKKSIFRTLSDKWKKEKTEANSYYFLVVRKIG